MPQPGSADYEVARDLGQRLAQAGFTVQTGGYVGVMEGVSRGANEAGGRVIGVTCDQIEAFRPLKANRWVTEEVRHPTLRERVLYLVDHCDGIIVMPGGIGTLSEFALAWSFAQVGEVPIKPIIPVGGLWQRTLAAYIDPIYIRTQDIALVTSVRTPAEAVGVLRERMYRQ
ncbi:MAG: LOG family protein [Anaerolineales bacterium]|nr:MAG: LOG family protein [Anaerolineales bacterium]